MSSQTMVPDNAGLLGFAFDKYVDQCEEVLVAFFGIKGSPLVEFRSWIYDSVDDADSMADTMHTEPLYLAAEFLGVDVTSPEFKESERFYAGFANRNSVQHRAA